MVLYEVIECTSCINRVTIECSMKMDILTYYHEVRNYLMMIQAFPDVSFVLDLICGFHDICPQCNSYCERYFINQ